MKLMNENNEEKRWELKVKETPEGIEFWAVDASNSSKYLARIMIIYQDGSWERDADLDKKLDDQGYLPSEHGFSYLADGALETSRDKTRRMHKAFRKALAAPVSWMF